MELFLRADIITDEKAMETQQQEVDNVNQIQLDELFAVGVSMTAESNHDATRIEQQTFTALYRTLQVTNREAAEGKQRQ
jgi:hypothetical protein